MDVLALILFLGVIILAFLRKTNVGILALAIGVIAVRIFAVSNPDMTDKALIGGVSSSMFVTLVGITLLFAIVNDTGALDLLARKIIAVAGKRIWIIPIAIYVAGFIIAGVGPGAIPALAIIPALAVSIALQVGYNPIMLALIGEAGLMAGRMTPITPEAAIITGAAESAGITSGVMGCVLLCQTLITVIFSIVIFLVYKGYRVKASDASLSLKSLEKFNGKQTVALLSIVVMLILIIFVKVNIGLAAMLVAGLLLLFHVANDSVCIKNCPWSTIIMVLGVGAFMSVVDAMGGIDLMSNGLASIMNKYTATPFMGVSAGLLSFVSSALGVVYPTMMPMSVDIAAQVGGVNPLALMAAVGAGGSLAGVSPMSTGGALILAALGTNKAMKSEKEENKVFVTLLLWALAALLIIAVVSFVVFNPIANAFYQA